MVRMVLPLVRMVLPLVRMVLLEVTGTFEELLEKRTLEDLLEYVLLVEIDDDDDDDERRRRNTLEDFLENLLLEEVVELLCGRRRGPCRGQKPLVGAKFEREPI